MTNESPRTGASATERPSRVAASKLASAGENRGEQGASPASPAADESVRKASNRRFDADKVARLRDAIVAGRYEIDHFSVADRFIEHERNGA